MVEFHLVGEVWHHCANKRSGQVIGILAVDYDFADILTQVVANSANNHVAFLEQEVWCFGTLSLGFNGVPELQ